MPQIYLPAEKLDKCQACGKGNDLQLCSRCGEVAYCSTECQKTDWKNHKSSCKKTDRIDLSSFYPVLACIAESPRLQVRVIHIALKHKVINAPNPTTPAELLPDGTHARVVRLGEPVDSANRKPDQSHWWPKGITPKVRGKLFRRILREGNVLPIVVGICVSLMLRMYSSLNEEGGTRTRLRYRSAGISDFDVVSGWARVTADDRLVYILPDGSILHGQDPEEHYWIYFTTQKGETVYLDCNLFTFNMALGIMPQPYLAPQPAQIFPPIVPVCFWDRTMRKGVKGPLSLLTEVAHFSFLRDETLREALGPAVSDLYEIPMKTLDAIFNKMEMIKGKPVTQNEKDYMINVLQNGINFLGHAFDNGAWKKFPAQPSVAIEADPGELQDL
ncbi:hypothetical protein M422DRAFT_189415 [Sphaerobolus stellatus SS14]|uniref:MYND-type domain-containing protein n=1 Tax=Sphaerobolus stellatus (strain SS14) TaxID=990650 RepID=A0A0C9UIH3_SPHS4|nr:hypothetical protein M422DRAFT_189415 [Sphaerobolus stellatus SS14]